MISAGVMGATLLADSGDELPEDGAVNGVETGKSMADTKLSPRFRLGISAWGKIGESMVGVGMELDAVATLFVAACKG